MTDGWLRIHYRFLQWEWYRDTNMVRLFIHFLLRANYKSMKYKGETIPRGSFVTSLDTLHRETELSPQQIRTCLKKLISTGEITERVTNKERIITVCKFKSYQNISELVNKQNNKQTNKRITDKQQTNNKQITTSKERKKERNNISISDEIESPPRILKSFFEFILEDWKATCHGFSVPRVLTESRKAKIRNRVAEMGGEEKAGPLVHTLFEKLAASPFLRGENAHGWKASFDWLFENDRNWVKVYEGQYDQPIINHQPPQAHDTTPPDRYAKRRGADSTARSAEDYTDQI